jgi:hypothetical protein
MPQSTLNPAGNPRVTDTTTLVIEPPTPAVIGKRRESAETERAQSEEEPPTRTKPTV